MNSPPTPENPAGPATAATEAPGLPRVVAATAAAVRPLFEQRHLMLRGGAELQSARAALEADFARRELELDTRREALEAQFAERAAALEAEAAQARTADALAAERSITQAVEDARIEGLERGQRDLAHAAAALQQAVDQFRTDCARSIERGAVALCGLLLERELETHPEGIVDLVAHVWDRCRGRSIATVRVRPADVEAVRAALDELRERAPDCAEISVLADAHCARHGVAIETTAGTCRFSLESWLEELRGHLTPADASGGA